MNIPGISLIKQTEHHSEKRAIIDSAGQFSYAQLLDASARFASFLLSREKDLKESRVAFLIAPGFQYVAAQWGIWRAGGIAVPLSVLHPRPELEYVVQDSDASILVAHPDFAERLRPIAKELGRRFILTTEALNAESLPLPEIEPDRRAMILYTSGTTGKPKGVVTTHKNIEVQIASLISAWGWTAQDHILHVLPLHHTHGIINVLCCAIWAGATCEFLPGFDAEAVWARFKKGGLTLFMAVPTIYTKLISFWEAAPPSDQKIMSEACSKMRLMVSGSAALPVSVLETWKSISSHVLLERYGMTETNMILSNPLQGKRVPGFVGTPLPGIEVKRLDEKKNPVKPEVQGEILVRGPGVFKEYWRKPAETKKDFYEGWFCTGDIAVMENGVYRLLGRSSVDIIKTGGYKVSALEIEEVLRIHPDIDDCAVVGIEDPEWGELVSAALILKEKSRLTLDSLRDWAKQQLAVYKIPRQILLTPAFPRNAMGKVSKPEIKRLFKGKSTE
ncbi:acyl-CoA synthetase [Acidobacteriota bacterium]